MDDGFPARFSRLSRRLLDPARGPARRFRASLARGFRVSRAAAAFAGRIGAPGRHRARGDRSSAPIRATLGMSAVRARRAAAPRRAVARAAAWLHPGCRRLRAGFRLHGACRPARRAAACCRSSGRRTTAAAASTGSSPPTSRRGGGEAASIRQMVAHALRQFQGDPGAGVRRRPVRRRRDGSGAAGRLSGRVRRWRRGRRAAGGRRDGRLLRDGAYAQRRRANRARRWSAGRAGPRRRHRWPRWPRLSVWHGNADQMVDPAMPTRWSRNGPACSAWPPTPTARRLAAPGVQRRVWGQAVEQWQLAGFGHAFPARMPGADPFVLPRRSRRPRRSHGSGVGAGVRPAKARRGALPLDPTKGRASGIHWFPKALGVWRVEGGALAC